MKFFLACAFSILSLTLSAQSLTVRGKITDQQGKGIPFASIYEKNTTIGTSANSEGEYSLRLNAGKHDLYYRAIGYRQVTRQIDLKTNYNLDVRLAEAVFELGDVIVKSDGEDPAYEVIRNAIKKRKAHLREADEYSTDVYIKGMQKMLAAPKKFLGKNIDDLGKEIGLDSNRTGIFYLSESESKLSYKQPDSYHEEMIASKVSGSNRAFSFNRASDININFYENIINMEGISNRPFISPIAENALFYYNYKLIGTSMENGELVNKIELIPKRGGDPVFRGFIYIIEDSWRIHSSDLYMTKQANINFVDTLSIRQQYIPVSSRVWLPSSIRYDFTGGLFGFRFGGYYLALYKNYDLSPGLTKKDFVEVLKITREVNKKDSIYWTQARPVPLTEEEKNDYEKKAVLAAKRESKPYLDSLDKVHNKFKPVQFVIGSGYNPRYRFRKEAYSFGSLINSAFYNTVEGFGINYQASYSKRLDSLTNKFVNFTGKVRYGFSSDKLYGSVSGNIPVKAANLFFNLGSDVLDLNSQGSISQLGNSINSLFYERNLLKLYEKKFFLLGVSQRFGGLLGSLNAEWANRISLENTSDYTVRDLKSRSFTPNNPFHSGIGNLPLFPENQSFKISLRGTYDFSNKYATYPTGRVHQQSKYPRLGVTYTRAFPGVFSSDADYSLLAFDLTKSDIKLGMYGQFKFWLGGGAFLNQTKIFFPDAKHFVGNMSLSYIPKINSFLFLDFYKLSTTDKYVEAHLEQNFSGFITNKLPLIRKLKLKEVAGINYLAQPNVKQYSEVYFGLEYLTFRVMYGFAYERATKVDKGIRIAYGF
ncbi:DUF5686 and carboxypeptidase regulatory-like domain-containing protein [Daejeonella lutea]|uniref:CarboxypepD_reg-like domain-containing protein n=1 Tax=Daejeonella lutea TaxID=572036 RepID=A0A1T5CSV7_9SPHI|nr:DUF5686 and carboxypeptidase regulatory-like domain-containing protein [Daejeonella lutea]SKB62504.1 CarboxypepD_reg-like domain-containing protein [Daejeonella lutea]